ncbi:MAG: N-acetyl-anhydromuramyl-L-alanine amidase AmpD [Psychrosphaera sp.]|jgi:N-acetyl-anhydromuramyl-L-alanine amidase AmpD
MDRLGKIGCFIILLCCGSNVLASTLGVEHLENQNFQSELIQDRAEYKYYFDLAYTRYPNLPDGILESLAYTASRWQHRIPSDSIIHDMRPQSIGLFGLYNTNNFGFVNTLSQVAKHSGVDEQRLIDNVEEHIFATASFLAHKLQSSKSIGKGLASTRKVLEHMSGISASTQINNYARESYAYDALLIANTGILKDGIMIKAQAIDWSLAFNKKELQQLQAPHMILDASKKSIRVKQSEDFIEESIKQEQEQEPENQSFNKSSKTSDNKYQTSSVVVDYEGAIWKESPNKSSRSGSQISHIVIHTTQGSYSGSINWLINPASQVSAHYIIRSSDGQVTQMVRENDKAWHARTANPYSIGIEHEGWVDNASWYTEAMYQSSADLSLDLCSRKNIDCSKAYQEQAHHNVVTLEYEISVKGHQHYPDQTHTDPGINWDWQGYYARVNPDEGDLPPNVAPEAKFTYSCIELKCRFDARASTDSDGSIVDYQWVFTGSSSTSGNQVWHEFSDSGDYEVTLTVIDNDAAKDSIIQQATIIKKSSGGSMNLLLVYLVALSFIRRKVNNISSQLYNLRSDLIS